MKLSKASPHAVRYAIMNWHYSKSVPLAQCAFNVYNDHDEWCGVIVYSIGANNAIARPYNLVQGEVCELVRVALNGKQEQTSKAVAISLRLLKEACPLLKLVVSYADEKQNHVGTIYQASNWVFVGKMLTVPDEYIYRGKQYHGRSFRQKFGSHTKYLDRGLEIVKASAKYKYLFPLTKEMRAMCASLKKEYPKHAVLAQRQSAEASTSEMAFESTVPLK